MRGKGIQMREMVSSSIITSCTLLCSPVTVSASPNSNSITSLTNAAQTILTPLKFVSFPNKRREIRVRGEVSCKLGRSFKLSASLPSNRNWVDAEASSPNEYEDDEYIVVNFYHFVFVKDPFEEVSKHLSFMQCRDIHGRIYLNEQGINAQYSGPSKDALAYAEWVKEDNRFSDILVQISPAVNGHAFPKLKLRYKPSLVQLEDGVSDLPVLDPSMRATPLTPSEWKNKLETLKNTEDLPNTSSSNCILLDVRNGYEWDVGHFQGAHRPEVDCFRSTSFGISDSESEPSSNVTASDPLATADKEKTDILMYCTGGIRCDVYSTILRQQGFQRLYTLKGGVSQYLEKEGPEGWVGNLFVFDSRLSLPPSAYKPENVINGTAKILTPKPSHSSFAKCYVCGSQVSELRHRNCANLDCNLLFLCCMKCVSDFRGCCCLNCTSAPRLRPVLTGHQRYQKWHNYRDIELQRS